ncbi:MAG: UDP-N-acetylglucosamine 1-carboxyvinyltransferase [Armatimonadetes bacterium]|nr:UDP-N-acetylglucosamine 1-carboxyvinyltransferase [Armatimonadota bacterium]
MDTLHIVGGRPLEGEVRISGSKNGTLPLLAAALLVEGETLIENVPDITDIRIMIQLLRTLGARCTSPGPGVLKIDASNISSVAPPADLMRAMRASFYVAGPLLARFGEAEVPLPGGCVLGQRPVDYHIRGFRELGADVRIEGGVMHARGAQLRGTELLLDGRTRSVGATVNLLLASVLADGMTIIENASREPEVVSCEELLQSCGAQIHGIGTSRLVIRGVKRLGPGQVRAIPDRMETGTFLIAGLITRGDVTVTQCCAEHMDVVLPDLKRAGAHIERDRDRIRLRAHNRPGSVEITTNPYPGFPTDLQPNMAVAAAIGTGTSVIEETIFDMRFTYTDELLRMGADIQVKDRVAIIRGVEQLSGAPVVATDLRAGSALVLAGLVAEGATEVSGADKLDRGYEDFQGKLTSLGAELHRPQPSIEEALC